MGYDLAIEQQQKIVMTPELKLALKILQLPAFELDQLVQAELEVNPVLELSEEPREEKGQETKSENEKITLKEKEIDWKEYLQYQGKSYCLESFDHDDSQDHAYDNLVTYDFTLQDHLQSQLNVLPISEELWQAADFIIHSLDQNGYLTISEAEISTIMNIEQSKVDKALSIVQGFEPSGVAARSLQECLLLQLKPLGLLDTHAETIIREYLDDIAANRLQLIGKKLAIPLAEAQRISDIIKRLEPKPGRSFEGSCATRYIIPDVVIEKASGEYVIHINDNYSSKLVVNPYYKSILRNEDKASQASQFINSKLTSAVWLIKSIEQRRSTLYNVMKAILDYQLDFFEKGILFLRTMTLKTIADEVSVHESTVSRAISGKFVQTPRGVYEIKYFFKSGVDSQDGDGVSSESIKNLIKSLIAAEDSAKPLSDQYIADALVKQGFNISRRTVAKYRDELGIPSSSKRKRF